MDMPKKYYTTVTETTTIIRRRRNPSPPWVIVEPPRHEDRNREPKIRPRSPSRIVITQEIVKADYRDKQTWMYRKKEEPQGLRYK